MTPLERRPLAGTWFRLLVPASVLAVAGAALVDSAGEVNELHAQIGSKLGLDSDQDGLADSQEYLLGTDADKRDTDGDGYHDLEEVARGSFPTDAGSIPGSDPIAVAQYSYQEFGFLKLHTAMYVADSEVDGLDFQFGLIIDGVPLPVSQVTLVRNSRSFQYKLLNDPNDSLLVLEMAIPEHLAQRQSVIHTYARLKDFSASQRPPAIDTSTFYDQNGYLVSAEPPPPWFQGGQGLIMSSISGPSNPPGNANGGEVCWQSIGAVGSSGSTIIYEVTSASCEDFDSYCDASACTASAGSTVELPDPGSLVGG